MFWERVGYLVRAGHLDAKLLWNGGDGVQVAPWWRLLAPWVGTQRALPGGGAWTYENFEWVARTMDALSRGAGNPAFDDATDMDAVPDILASIRTDSRLQSRSGPSLWRCRRPRRRRRPRQPRTEDRSQEVPGGRPGDGTQLRGLESDNELTRAALGSAA